MTAERDPRYAQAVGRLGARPKVGSHEEQYDALRKVVGPARSLSWGTMVYACSQVRLVRGAAPLTPGPGFEGVPRPQVQESGCGWEHRVQMLVGVEGPDEFRQGHAFVPAPMMCGTCPRCGGSLSHVRWHEDEAFEPRAADATTARFELPGKGTGRAYASQGYGGAHYVDPTGQTTRGRTT